MMVGRRAFSTGQEWPSFLTQEKGAAVDVLLAESNDIMFNLATEEYIFEHVDVVNPILFLWRNSPTIIIGKHQNPWKECHVQKLEDDKVVLQDICCRSSHAGGVNSLAGIECWGRGWYTIRPT